MSVKFVTIDFPDWVKPSTKCETRTHSAVFPRNFFTSHGAVKRVTTYENHDVETEWDEEQNLTYFYFTNPVFPIRLHVKVGSESRTLFDD